MRSVDDHIGGHFVLPVDPITDVSVGDIGDGIDPVVVFWFGNVQLLGRLSVLTDRLEAATAVLCRARDQPQLRELLLPRRRRQGIFDRRTWIHPFRDPPGLVPAPAAALESSDTSGDNP